MSVKCHPHVSKAVPTQLAAISVHVVLDINWMMMDNLVQVYTCVPVSQHVCVHFMWVYIYSYTVTV